MGGRTKLEAAEALAAAGIAAGPCNDAADLVADEHLARREMLVELEAADGATYLVPGNPVHVAGTRPRPDRRAPWLGEDTDSILGDELGLDAERIAALRADGIVA